MNHDTYNASISALLDEVNASKGLDLILHPSWNYPILDARTFSAGYKLHCSKGGNRIMSLAVDTFRCFEQTADGRATLTANAKRQIVAAIETFWSGGHAETHVF